MAECDLTKYIAIWVPGWQTSAIVMCFHSQSLQTCNPIYWALHVHELDASLLLTAVDCGTLTTPANGQVTYSGRTTFGHTATYSCHTGYNLIGGTTRMCQVRRTTGVWSGSAPTCHRMLLLIMLE